MTISKFEKMHIAMRYWLYGKEYYIAAKAMNFAAKYHVGFRKDNTTPEFHHQISIASYLRTLPGLMYEEEILTVSFLHDVVEDYKIDLKEITDNFGFSISKAVNILTKKSGIKELNYFRPMIECPVASIVKGGDRIHNFQTMNEVFSKDKKREYIEECENYILPMLKKARRKFPQQEPAYENIKLVLLSQIELLNITLS
jgi:(p)ppGpp synthase/HD superfamily hydrolase